MLKKTRQSRLSLKVFSGALLLVAIAFFVYQSLPPQQLARQLKARDCQQALQTYVQLHAPWSDALTTAQFYLDYDPTQLPGPYVFINLVGSDTEYHDHRYRIVAATNIFGPALSMTPCSNLDKAQAAYETLPNSAYARNMLALIYFTKQQPQRAIEALRQASSLTRQAYPLKHEYSNAYQGLRAFAWLIVNAPNDHAHYVASKRLVDGVDDALVKLYGNTIIDRIPIWNLYLDSLAEVTRMNHYGINGVAKNPKLAQRYLKRYAQACQQQNLSSSCDAELLAQYKGPMESVQS